MTYTSTLLDLKKKIRIIEVIDLSDHDDPKKETLYQVLQKHRSPVFKPHERLVVIVDNSLTHTFESEPPDILPKLHIYAEYFDIPHEHILVLSNINKISQQLRYLKNKYSSKELVPMPFIFVDRAGV